MILRRRGIGAGQLYRFHLHPSDVDEFPAPYPRVADAAGEKWRHQRHSSALHLPNQNHHQHPGRHHPRHGIQLPAFHGAPIYNVLCKIDDNTINAARDLGASFTQTLFHMWFPAQHPGHHQRHYHGICPGADNLRNLQLTGRQQDSCSSEMSSSRSSPREATGT